MCANIFQLTACNLRTIVVAAQRHDTHVSPQILWPSRHQLDQEQLGFVAFHPTYRSVLSASMDTSPTESSDHAQQQQFSVDAATHDATSSDHLAVPTMAATITLDLPSPQVTATNRRVKTAPRKMQLDAVPALQPPPQLPPVPPSSSHHPPVGTAAQRRMNAIAERVEQSVNVNIDVQPKAKGVRSTDHTDSPKSKRRKSAASSSTPPGPEQTKQLPILQLPVSIEISSITFDR